MNDILTIVIWVLLVGAIFGFAWKRGYIARLGAYVGETREELRKCSWPSLEELKGSTVVVMVTIVLIGGFTVIADFIISQFMRMLLSLG